MPVVPPRWDPVPSNEVLAGAVPALHGAGVGDHHEDAVLEAPDDAWHGGGCREFSEWVVGIPGQRLGKFPDVGNGLDPEWVSGSCGTVVAPVARNDYRIPCGNRVRAGRKERAQLVWNAALPSP